MEQPKKTIEFYGKIYLEHDLLLNIFRWAALIAGTILLFVEPKRDFVISLFAIGFFLVTIKNNEGKTKYILSFYEDRLVLQVPHHGYRKGYARDEIYETRFDDIDEIVFRSETKKIVIYSNTMPNVPFTVTDGNENVVYEQVRTDSSGNLNIKLKHGTYTITEVVPDGYKAFQSFTIVVDEDGNVVSCSIKGNNPTMVSQWVTFKDNKIVCYNEPVASTTTPTPTPTPASTSDLKAKQTGDSLPLKLLTWVALGSGAACIILYIYSKKKSN